MDGTMLGSCCCQFGERKRKGEKKGGSEDGVLGCALFTLC